MIFVLFLLVERGLFSSSIKNLAPQQIPQMQMSGFLHITRYIKTFRYIASPWSRKIPSGDGVRNPDPFCILGRRAIDFSGIGASFYEFKLE